MMKFLLSVHNIYPTVQTLNNIHEKASHIKRDGVPMLPQIMTPHEYPKSKNIVHMHDWIYFRSLKEYGR